MSSAALDQLTRRQRECLALVALGLTSKEIATVLGIEPTTVDVTLKRAARRTGISDRRRLARAMAEQEPEMTQLMLQRLGHEQKRLVSNDFALEQGGAQSGADLGLVDRTGLGATPRRASEDLSPTEKRLLAIAVAFAAIATLLALVRLSKFALASIAA
ncbi:helix-turn-helix domain-containing protein [Sphingomonas nostoxanthinifaciens]|uniref:helix-turn-helix domain-containing protein n=1 Tax=Sphingomonas nostoxanthinifaciens TaxID=2872652 RepID=UPI001CC1F6BC|nr:helix-turn-helix transcriptional regulator [Sphingomonas nostoxanthinifaciens]UAK23758.1 helix-turn-helix transcriptional regulator [Sphingomonas nostoxanthinifaciens]